MEETPIRSQAENLSVVVTPPPESLPKELTKKQLKNRTPAAAAARKKYYQKNSEVLRANYKSKYYPRYKDQHMRYFMNRVAKANIKQQQELEQQTALKEIKEIKCENEISTIQV